MFLESGRTVVFWVTVRRAAESRSEDSLKGGDDDGEEERGGQLCTVEGRAAHNVVVGVHAAAAVVLLQQQKHTALERGRCPFRSFVRRCCVRSLEAARDRWRE